MSTRRSRRLDPAGPSPSGHARRCFAARSIGSVVVVGSALGLLSGCSHDWEAYLPVGEPSGSGNGTGGAAGAGGDGGRGGAGGLGNGGAGGMEPPGVCPPLLAGPSLIKVATPGGKAYCVDSTEVTNEHYMEWLNANPSTALQPAHCNWNLSFVPAVGWPPGDAVLNNPVAHVDWCDAVAYCTSNGKHLCGRVGAGSNTYADFADPESSEWFNACTGSAMTVYPYADVYDPVACNGTDYAVGATLPVAKAGGCEGGFSGLYDMSGNVWEWENSCDDSGGAADLCRLRGGGFNNSAPNLACAANNAEMRSTPAVNIGFRCCIEVDVGR
jgi:hypothetical protein